MSFEELAYESEFCPRGVQKAPRGPVRISGAVLLSPQALPPNFTLPFFHSGSLEFTLWYGVQLDLSEIGVWSFCASLFIAGALENLHNLLSNKDP